MKKDFDKSGNITLWLVIIVSAMVLKQEGILPVSWLWALIPLWGPFAIAGIFLGVLAVAIIISEIIRIYKNGKVGRR